MTCFCCLAPNKRSGILQVQSCDCVGFCLLCQCCEKHHNANCTTETRTEFLDLLESTKKQLQEFRLRVLG